jgi:hypothetical protein
VLGRVQALRPLRGAFGGLDTACARREVSYCRRRFFVVVACRELLADVLDGAWSDARQGILHLADQWPEILHAIRVRANDDQPEGQHVDIVLVFQLAIHGRSASICPAARRRSSPFLTPAHPKP